MAQQRFDSTLSAGYSMVIYNHGELMLRKCIRCGEEKRIESFKWDKRYPDGRTATCRYCYDHRQLTERIKTREEIEKQASKLRGRKYTLEHRLAISRGQHKAVAQGKHHWKVNTVPNQDTYRMHLEYKLWRENVLELKGMKCELCQSIKRLHVHHIKCFYEYPELRTVIENGQVLCQSCHMKLTWQERRRKDSCESK
jgi:HNH endonuclease